MPDSHVQLPSLPGWIPTNFFADVRILQWCLLANDWVLIDVCVVTRSQVPDYLRQTDDGAPTGMF